MKTNPVISLSLLRSAGLPILLFVLNVSIAGAQGRSYSTVGEVNKRIKELASGADATVKTLAVSPGGNEILVIEIGKNHDTGGNVKPAILVAGNPDGDRVIATEAALRLAAMVLADKSRFATHSWYIVPMVNPDAMGRYFSEPRFAGTGNLKPDNDDMDELVDEDGFNDLDGNGVITRMRLKAPDGEWLPVAGDPRLMRRAEYKDGEKGLYKLYYEGVDDDGDGKYNEDGVGGTNVNANFPHLFKYFTPGNGFYPGSTPESYALMKYAFDHPEIAMTFSFGNTNFLLVPPRGGRKGSVDMEQISIPAEIAGMLGFEADRTYSMKEIMEKVQPMLPPGMEVDEGMIASFLGLGAVVNPMQEDLVFYGKISEDYKKYLKDKGADSDRFDPAAAKDGSFELWSYYHLGVPVFSMDLWSVPKPKEEKKEASGITLESLENMSPDEFVALGEEKISLFLKESGTPEQFTAANLIGMVKSGQVTPKQMAGMMKQMPKPAGDTKKGDPEEQALLAFSDKYLGGDGFVQWKEYDHPDLGRVEIGGFKPYIGLNPPAAMADSILDIQLPWLFTLEGYLPELSISEIKRVDLGGGVYRIEAWVNNSGFIPFVTAMGKRNKIPSPAIVTITGDGIKLLSGKERTPVNDVGGNAAIKLQWLIQAENKGAVSIRLESKSAGGDSKQIKL